MSKKTHNAMPERKDSKTAEHSGFRRSSSDTTAHTKTWIDVSPQRPQDMLDAPAANAPYYVRVLIITAVYYKNQQ